MGNVANVSIPTIHLGLFRTESGKLTNRVGDVLEVVPGVDTVSWSGLPESDAKGNPYEYFILEVDAQGNEFKSHGFDRTVTGYTITFTYSPLIEVVPMDAKLEINTLMNKDLITLQSKFDLYRLNQDGTKTLVGVKDQSTINGQLTYSDLLYGKYELIEITSPKGYVTTSHKFTFELNDKQVKVIDVMYEKIKLNLTGTINWDHPNDIFAPDIWLMLIQTDSEGNTIKFKAPCRN